MDRYKNKYRNASARAQWWDYGWNGAYFITICTRGREHFFGEIDNGIMKLSPMGVIADILWHEIPNHASFVGLGDFVVMPNHVHGILILDKPEDEYDGRVDGPNIVDCRDGACPVPTIVANTMETNEQQNTKFPYNWTNPVSKYRKKYGFVNNWILQICRYQTRQPFGIRKWMAIPFSRSHN